MYMSGGRAAGVDDEDDDDDMDILNGTYRNFCCGALATVVPDFVLYPLDTVNVRMKAINSYEGYSKLGPAFRTIVKEEGIRRGLYPGVSMVLLASLPANGVYFASYELAKSAGTHYFRDNPECIPLVHFAAGGFSELATSIVNVPVEVVKSRLQLQGSVHMNVNYKYSHPIEAFASIVRSEGGVRGLYCSLRQSLLLECGYSACQFCAYEYFKSKASIWKGEKLSIQENLVTGGLAGALAGAITNPLDILVCRFQTQGEPRKYENIRHAFSCILREEGPKGFARGLVPRVLWLAPYAGLQFAAYEFLKSLPFTNPLAAGSRED